MSATATPEVVILGSTNWDICLYLPRLPAPGDTVGDGRIATAIGGKGANQAVACHLAGVSSRFVSCIGDDQTADVVESTFSGIGMDMEGIRRCPGTATGTACIFIDANGENCIGLTAGANAQLGSLVVESASEALQSAATLLLQLETPLDSTLQAARLASQAGTRVVLNPAPARALPADLYPLSDVMTPNRGELAELTGIDTDSDAGLEAASKELLERGVGRVIVTLGNRGALLASRSGLHFFQAYEADAVDTTAAGDVFNGYFAAGLSRLRDPSDEDLAEPIRHAMAAAAIAVTREGAIPSIPANDEVTALRRRRQRQ